MQFEIRPETSSDRSAVFQVNQLAFAQDDEAKLVDALRDGGFALNSFIAECNGKVVGHILFTRLTIADTGQAPWVETPAVALAPLAVLPDYQRQGVGSALVEVGLRTCQGQGEAIVIVLGDPVYYRRFGFRSELADALQSPYQGEHFMALELVPGALSSLTGEVRYPPPFSG